MLSISKVRAPLTNNLRKFGVALAATGLLAVGATSCSNSKRKEVDPATLHKVNIPWVGDLYIQDGISVENNSKIYLFDKDAQNGRIKVYDKGQKRWSTTYTFDLYDYQAQVLGNIAAAQNEIEGKKVLSKQDIKYMQRHSHKIFDNRPYRNPDCCGINSKRGRSLDLHVGMNNYSLFHITDHFKISHSMNENKLVK